MAEPGSRHVWVHSLGAKVGGGLTYLYAILPEIAAQLEGKGVRVTLLLPERLEGLDLPAWMVQRPLPRAARSALTRLLFDQLVLPVWLLGRRDAVLYCSGSFAPVVKPVRTVTLLRNAIYFDETFLERSTPKKRRSFRLQGALIALGARGCAAIQYPTRAMRDLVEACHPRLAAAGEVNHYGISRLFAEAGAREGAGSREAGDGATFLYVMNYTLQKNLGMVLRALAAAKREGLPVRVVITSKLDRPSSTSYEEDMRTIEEHDLVGSGHLVLAGPTHGEALVELYRSVDACLFPSFCESFGHPLVEAMAMGRPLVCADRPYARELCGEHAVYVDPDRPEELVDVWRRWDDVAGRIPRPPAGWLAERFSWRDHVSRLIASLLGPAGGQ